MSESCVAGRRAHQCADVDAGVELLPRPALTEEELAELAAERAARAVRHSRGGEYRWGCACNLPCLLCCAQTCLHLLPLVTPSRPGQKVPVVHVQCRCYVEASFVGFFGR